MPTCTCMHLQAMIPHTHTHSKHTSLVLCHRGHIAVERRVSFSGAFRHGGSIGEQARARVARPPLRGACCGAKLEGARRIIRAERRLQEDCRAVGKTWRKPVYGHAQSMDGRVRFDRSSAQMASNSQHVLSHIVGLCVCVSACVFLCLCAHAHRRQHVSHLGPSSGGSRLVFFVIVSRWAPPCLILRWLLGVPLGSCPALAWAYILLLWLGVCPHIVGACPPLALTVVLTWTGISSHLRGLCVVGMRSVLAFVLRSWLAVVLLR